MIHYTHGCFWFHAGQQERSIWGLANIVPHSPSPTLHLFNQICVIKFVSISIFLYVSTILEGSVHWYAGGSLRPYVTSGGLIGLAEESGCWSLRNCCFDDLLAGCVSVCVGCYAVEIGQACWHVLRCLYYWWDSWDCQHSCCFWEWLKVHVNALILGCCFKRLPFWLLKGVRFSLQFALPALTVTCVVTFHSCNKALVNSLILVSCDMYLYIQLFYKHAWPNSTWL